jgi:hypothetical protein
LPQEETTGDRQLIARPQRFQKFLFNAACFALDGHIRKPYYQKLGRHVPLESYAGSEVHAIARNEGFAIGRDFMYGAVSSEITARREESVYHTIVQTTVEKLQIRDRLTVGRLVARLESRYDLRDYPGRKPSRVLPAGSTIEGVMLDGRQIDVRLPPAFTLTDDEREAFYAGKYDRDPRFHPGYIPDPVHVDGFGTLWFAEWAWVHPDEQEAQHITMLRLGLGSDYGADADAASVRCDGRGWPP